MNYNQSKVSLFTREWIEIEPLSVISGIPSVSLFTREWIEMFFGVTLEQLAHGLPLYEGVD